MKHLDILRQIKHQAFVVLRKTQLRVQTVREAFWTRRYRHSTPSLSDAQQLDRRLPVHRHLSSTFPVNHLLLPTPSVNAGTTAEQAPHRLYVLWLGDNPLTPNRRLMLARLRERNPDLPIHLVTVSDLRSLELPEHPFHPAFDFLSAVHKSDYMRMYLMHHFGGAYADLKDFRGSFRAMIDTMNDSPECWAIGPQEHLSTNVGVASGPLGREQRHFFSRTPSQACFAFRPRTPLTAEWSAEVERRLDYYSSLLREHPALDPYGTNPGYPVQWYSLLAAVLNPLMLKHFAHIRVERRLKMSSLGVETYR